MNYRQWKKAYKKKHGVNPQDKRKAKKDLYTALSDLAAAISECTAKLTEALIPAMHAVCEQAKQIVREMPSWVQQMPEDKFQAMLAEAETAEVRAILVRMRYGGNHDEDIHSR